jgi:uncharacterized protein
MSYILIALAWLLIVAGLLGVIIPGLPGIPLILGGMVLYAFQTGFQAVGTDFLIIMALFTLAGTAADYLSGIIGAKRSGASRLGIWGAFLGGLAGLILLPVWGIFIGPLFGAIIGEMMSGKNKESATRVGLGTFLGIMTGTLLKLIIGTTMVVLFIKQLI